MHPWIHTDASYLTEPKARSCDGSYHYFSNKIKLPIQSDNPPPKHNQPFIVLCKFIDAVLISTQESETGVNYINSKEIIPIHQTATEMGRPQGPTTFQFDNKCAHEILTEVLKTNIKVWTCSSTGFMIYPYNRKNSMHITNKANTTYENLQQCFAQINVIELFPPSMYQR